MVSVPKMLAGLGVGYAGWKYLDGKYQLAKDFHDIKKILPGIIRVSKIVKDPEGSLIKYWYETLSKPGQLEKRMIIAADDGRILTFRDVEEQSNKVAHWALSKGWAPGTVVSLMMDNRVEFTPLWLGLAKVGIVTAFINTNLRGKPMAHAIQSGGAVAAIFGTEHAEVAQVSVDQIREGGVKTLISYGSGSPAGVALPDMFDESLDESLPPMPTSATDDKIWKERLISDPCFYIYTSGTTGLPKACKMSHYKLCAIAPVTCPMFEIQETDTIYSSGLPLYHGAANIAVLAAIYLGCTVCSRVKFSASSHWEDCAKYNVTAMQYIGELCRYLLAAPPRDADKGHQVRIAFGNGLRPEIWDQFQRRFNIPEIGEIYGATEANSGCYNHCKNYEGQGAVGRAGAVLGALFATKILRFDIEADEVVRDKTGLCIEADFNEVGELVAPIRELQAAHGKMENFEGYTNVEATEKKILRDVFKKGDQYFRSGDLLKRDEKGYFYFVDRIGDTFRWKGENVSTMEVSEVISSFPGVVDANVLGVQIPGKDGRAGLVVLTVEEGTELNANFRQEFATYCRANLPGYSVPVFVRIPPSGTVNVTGTFKHQKVEYRNQGCDPNGIPDDMWWYDPSTGSFEEYGSDQHQKISSGMAKL